MFSTLKNKLKDLVSTLEGADTLSIDEFLPVIFGILEGSSGSMDPMLILAEQFGEAI